VLTNSAARIYRYIRFRKGYGVHSPFAFGLINKVIEEKKPFYIFEEIEKKAPGRRMKVSSPEKYGRLLFRLINFFQAKTVLQIGVSEKIWTEYLSAAAEQLVVVDQDYLPAMEDACKELNVVDFIFLNVSKDPELTQLLFNHCLGHVHKGTVLLIDGIHKKKMRKLWQNIKNRNDIPVTMDLYVLGLVFFNKDLHKKNYKLFF
jgi:predicted O-methyltransferase YrrM